MRDEYKKLLCMLRFKLLQRVNGRLEIHRIWKCTSTNFHYDDFLVENKKGFDLDNDTINLDRNIDSNAMYSII